MLKQIWFVHVAPIAWRGVTDVCYVDWCGKLWLPGAAWPIIKALKRMIEAEVHLDGWMPGTEGDQKAVRRQLERMLESPLFSNSKRYPALLRFLVEQALDGNDALLKERTLGVTVFHRAPDYDTNQDTVVRLTASEVRKRIAQYYHQPQHAGELQIDLRPGSYVPVFRRALQVMENPGLVTGHDFSRADGAPQYARALAPEGSSLGFPASQSPAREVLIGHLIDDGADSPNREATYPARRSFALPLRWVASVAALAALIAAALIAWSANQSAHGANRQLWAPILSEPGQVQLVIADLSSSVSGSADRDNAQAAELIQLLRMGEMVNYRDTLAQAGLVAFLARHDKPFALALSTQASYPDLQRGASVLVGGLDNVWTMRVTEPLRFHFVRRGATYIYAIVDRQHPEQDGWNVNMVQSFDRATEDFAIVARIFDQTTGRPVLVVAGLGANGTNAAAQFLLDPARTAELTAHAPRDWQRLNMEAVLRTQILDNHAGPPHLVTCTFW